MIIILDVCFHVLEYSLIRELHYSSQNPYHLEHSELNKYAVYNKWIANPQ